jgi:hypothetical protein
MLHWSAVYPFRQTKSPLTGYDGIPAYLRTHYWWAYIHPHGVEFFERQWLVNLILWDNPPGAMAQIGQAQVFGGLQPTSLPQRGQKSCLGVVSIFVL